MPVPAILVITGASGVGKTTMLRALDAQALPGVRCHHFDSIGVPPTEEMIARFGSPDSWQTAMTHHWVSTLASSPADTALAVLEGQVRPAVVREAFTRNHVRRGHILLLDCTAAVRERRLRHDRAQPELATDRMTAWAAYLRGQADALRVPVLDTSTLSVEAATAELRAHVERLLRVLAH
jgi:hypothetical protein